ncbi:hypothetical protein TGVAND_237530 [Toxoplasma gondii VAND]|uniref:RNA-editing substrate-binding complex 6 protein domain-containing protein n=1 Tax=Toxoplasma gondii VAND TaxID=933077 RepID=A0A086Q507_TOXGO|nr:hypothetical protein TGVAND_237530 [Toxoplasma gondii VAND]
MAGTAGVVRLRKAALCFPRAASVETRKISFNSRLRKRSQRTQRLVSELPDAKGCRREEPLTSDGFFPVAGEAYPRVGMQRHYDGQIVPRCIWTSTSSARPSHSSPSNGLASSSVCYFSLSGVESSLPTSVSPCFYRSDPTSADASPHLLSLSPFRSPASRCFSAFKASSSPLFFSSPSGMASRRPCVSRPKASLFVADEKFLFWNSGEKGSRTAFSLPRASSASSPDSSSLLTSLSPASPPFCSARLHLSPNSSSASASFVSSSPSSSVFSSALCLPSAACSSRLLRGNRALHSYGAPPPRVSPTHRQVSPRDAEVPFSRLFSPFNPTLKSPFQALARPEWRRGPQVSPLSPASPSSIDAQAAQKRSREEEREAGGEDDVLIEEALWWVRQTRQITVEVVDQWTESFHFLYRKKKHAELIAILDDALHLVPCLRPAEIAMLANHASRLIPLKAQRLSQRRERRPGCLLDSEKEAAEKRAKRWWGVFGDAISHLLHDADGQHISLILNAFSSAKVFHHETLLACLSRETAAWAPHNSLRNTAVILNAMARLNMRDREALDSSCLRLQSEAKNLNHIDCAMALNAAARLGYRELQFYSVLGDAAVQHCSRMNEHNISMILWAFGAVGVRHQTLIGEFIDQLLRISSSRVIHANYVASILGPLGNLRVEHSRMKLLVDVLVKPNIEKFEPVDAILVCTALSRLGFRVSQSPVASQLLTHAGRLVATNVFASPSHHILHLAVAAGLLEAFTMTAFWSDISGGLAATLRSTVSSAEIANAVLPLVRVVGTPVWRAPLFQVAVTAMAAQDQSQWTPRDVANFTFALGKISGEHGEDPVDPSVFRASGDNSAAPQKRNAEAGGHSRRQLIRDLCEFATREMDRFNPCDIVRLLQGLACLDCRHEGVLASVSRRLQHADGSSPTEAEGFPFHVQRAIAEALLKLEASHACSRDWIDGLRSHQAALGHKGGGKEGGAGEFLSGVSSSCFRVEEVSSSSAPPVYHQRTHAVSRR